MSGDGKKIVSGSDDKTVRRLDTESGALLCRFHLRYHESSRRLHRCPHAHRASCERPGYAWAGYSTTAHRIGIATMPDRPASFPFAAITMTLAGIFCTCLVTLPPVRPFLSVELGKMHPSPVA